MILLKPFLILLGATGVATSTVVTFIPPEEFLLLPKFFEPNDNRIDLNGDGIDDVRFGGFPNQGPTFTTLGANRYLAIPATPPNVGGVPSPLQDNTIIGSTTPGGLAWLNTDVVDGFVSETDTGKFTSLFNCLSSGCSGPFYPGFDTLRASIGVEFQAADGLHYGYLDITIPPRGRLGFINGWAYEDEPNKEIATTLIPEPTSTLLSILGFGLLASRKRRA